MKDKLIEIHAALNVIRCDAGPDNIWAGDLNNITNALDILIFAIEQNEDD